MLREKLFEGKTHTAGLGWVTVGPDLDWRVQKTNKKKDFIEEEMNKLRSERLNGQ